MIMKGTMGWFDGSSGEGQVFGEDGEIYYLHYTAVEGVRVGHYQYPDPEDQDRLRGLMGAKVEFTLYENLYSKRVDHLRFIE